MVLGGRKIAYAPSNQAEHVMWLMSLATNKAYDSYIFQIFISQVITFFTFILYWLFFLLIFYID
jgi:hypothetical protein